MSRYKMYIKNMVCRRCVMTVEDICRDLGLKDARVELGYVEVDAVPDKETLQRLDERLAAVGFERIESDEVVLLERIKALVREYARSGLEQRVNLSTYVEQHVALDFRYVSRLFSTLEGRTIRTYLMMQRIEYVKELLLDNELTLAEIADAAGFSSVAHLSTAFKKHVGLTLSDFKTGGVRTSLDEV